MSRATLTIDSLGARRIHGRIHGGEIEQRHIGSIVRVECKLQISQLRRPLRCIFGVAHQAPNVDYIGKHKINRLENENETTQILLLLVSSN